uniref:PID domain-containing protein n=1 Tax=Strongyloides stercoralis TaxID=6248 RepID=A0A0K0EAJ2_STRER
MVWLWNKKSPKTYFHVLYLGARETDHLRNEKVTNSLMKEQLENCFIKVGNKATITLSEKGLKLIQTIPIMNKNGYVKIKTMHINVPGHCITFSMIGNMPFNDTVGVTMIILNPEMHSPIHLHVYRCDTSQIAQIMHEKIQYLINLSNNQRLLYNLEKKLYLKSTIDTSEHFSEFDASNFMKNNTITSVFNKKNSIERERLRSRHSIAMLPYNNYDTSISNKNSSHNINSVNLLQENDNISMGKSLILPYNINKYSNSSVTSKRLYIKENKNNTYNGNSQISSLKKLFKKKRLPIEMFNNNNY